VSKVISHNMVSVYFCDFGDFTVLPIDRLQPLTNWFKKLPYQAIKAKLAGEFCKRKCASTCITDVVQHR
jgi:tudor domain-containing protein 1/4/6/7